MERGTSCGNRIQEGVLRVKIVKKQSVSEKTNAEIAQEELEREGMISIVNDPEDVDKEYLALPSNLSDLPPRDLGKYLNALTMQMIWIRTLMTRIDVLISEADFELDFIRAKLFPQLDKKMSVTEKELNLLNEENAVPYVKNIRFLQQKRAILDANWKSLDDAKFNVSREISLRVGEQKDAGRMDNVNGMKRGEIRRGIN